MSVLFSYCLIGSYLRPPFVLVSLPCPLPPARRGGSRGAACTKDAACRGENACGWTGGPRPSRGACTKDAACRGENACGWTGGPRPSRSGLHPKDTRGRADSAKWFADLGVDLVTKDTLGRTGGAKAALCGKRGTALRARFDF